MKHTLSSILSFELYVRAIFDATGVCTRRVLFLPEHATGALS